MRRRALLSNGVAPIMSFQTDKNGTFNPNMSVASGTLKWIIDGVEYITNSPSVALTGSTIDVEVFANDTIEGVDVNGCSFLDDAIIGESDFSWFTMKNQAACQTNPDLTNIKFSTFSNNITSGLIVNDCNILALDLSNVLIESYLYVWNNSNLSNITFSTGVNTFTQLYAYLCNISSIDLSNTTIMGLGQLRLDNNPLTSIVQPIVTTTFSLYLVNNCALPQSEVDEIFSSLNTFFSSNAPLNNLTVNASGGTSASPTGGSSNTDLVNLRDVVYPAAGFTFTAVIN